MVDKEGVIEKKKKKIRFGRKELHVAKFLDEVFSV
jgi:hypothetical protein